METRSSDRGEGNETFLRPAAGCVAYTIGFEPFLGPVTLDPTGRYAALLDVHAFRWLVADLAHGRAAYLRYGTKSTPCLAFHQNGPRLAASGNEKLEVVSLGAASVGNGLRFELDLVEYPEAIVGCFDETGERFSWIGSNLWRDRVEVSRVDLVSGERVRLFRHENARLITAALDRRTSVLCFALGPKGKDDIDEDEDENATFEIHVLAPFAGWHRNFSVAQKPKVMAVDARSGYLAFGTDKRVVLCTLEGHVLGSIESERMWPHSLDFHPHEPLLLVGEIRSLEVWEVKGGEFRRRAARKGHEVGNGKSAWCLDGTSVIATSMVDSTEPLRARLFDPDLRGPVAELGGVVRGVNAVAGQGNTVCALLCDSSLVFFDNCTLRPVDTIPLPVNKLRQVRVSRDGKWVLTNEGFDELLVIQAENRRRRSIRLPEDLELLDFDVADDPAVIVCLVFRDGFPGGDWEGYLMLFRADEPTHPPVRLPIGRGRVHLVRVDTSARLAVTCGPELRVWDLRDRRRVWSWRPESLHLVLSDIVWVNRNAAIVAVVTDWRKRKDTTTEAGAEIRGMDLFFGALLPQAVRVLRIDPESWKITGELELDLEDDVASNVTAYTDPEGKRLILSTGHLIDCATMEVLARTRPFKGYINWQHSVKWRHTTTGIEIGPLLGPPAVELLLGHGDQCALLSKDSFAGARELVWEENHATWEVSEVEAPPVPWVALVKLAGIRGDE